MFGESCEPTAATVWSVRSTDFGLPAALKAAGLSNKVKFIGEAPTETNFSYIRSGQEGATVSQAYYEIWANMLDAAARTVTGQSIAVNNSWKVRCGPSRLRRSSAESSVRTSSVSDATSSGPPVNAKGWAC